MTDARRLVASPIVERVSRESRPLYLWGAGAGGRGVAAALVDRGVRVSGFVDRDPLKIGSRLDGHLVVAPATLLACRPRPRVVIASIHWREILLVLRRAGFRSRRDVDVFPVEGIGDLPRRVCPDARGAIYAAWHRDWLAAEGVAAVGAGPAVLALALPAQLAGYGATAVRSRLARAVDDDATWVVLHDARAGRIRWRWKSSAARASGAQVASAVYDWKPPTHRDAERPFLLRALAHTASLVEPVLCRGSVVRAFLGDAGRDVSLGALHAWIEQRGFVRHDVAGFCELARRTSPTAPARMRPAGPVAPGLVRFATDLADAGLTVFGPEEVGKHLPTWTDAHVEAGYGLEYLRSAGRRTQAPVVLQILAHGRGNFFFTEIRDFLAAAWRRAGADVSVADERSAPAPGARAVVVAPHEFFGLGGHHPAWGSARDVVLVNTEQPQTRWFAAGMPRLLASPLVFDLNLQTALLLRALGVAAHFLPLGWETRSDLARPRRLLPARGPFAGMSGRERRLNDDRSWRARPIDVLFVGTLSSRRAMVFARTATSLTRYRCFLHLPPGGRPLAPGSDDALTARDMADLCRRSKIVLNVHRDDLSYCEWHRVVFHGMRHGALVLSEPMMRVPVFAPGRDYLVAELADLPRCLAQLLSTSGGARRAARVAAHGQATFQRQFDAGRMARRTMELL